MLTFFLIVSEYICDRECTPNIASVFEWWESPCSDAEVSQSFSLEKKIVLPSACFTIFDIAFMAMSMHTG